MPYENYHACLVNPNITQILGTQTRKHDGKTYQVRIGRAKGKTTGSAERSYLYPKSQWTAAQARAHCKDHGGTFEAAKKGWEEIYFQFKGLDEVEQEKFLNQLSIDFCKEIIEDSREGKYSELLGVRSKDEKLTENLKRNPFAKSRRQHFFKGE